MDTEKELIAFMESEARIFQMVQELKQELKARVAAVPFRGEVISDGENGKPLICVMKFSQLQDKWDLSYHAPKEQGEAVEHKLKTCTTTKAVCRALYDMMSCGYVTMYGCDNYRGSNRIYLNKETLAVLRNSEIGKYALAHPPKVDKEPYEGIIGGVCRYCGHRVPDTGYVIDRDNDDIFCDDDCLKAWKKEKGKGAAA